jgi:hypothetical protein
LNEIVDSLKNIIQPFNDVEEVAGQLGIPVDATGKPSKSSDLSSNIDPRSPEFREILSRVSKALLSLHDHPEIKDNDRYLIWLLQVQKRADSLVGKTMLDLINNAKRICKDELIKKDHQKHTTSLTNHPAGEVSSSSSGGGGGGIRDSPLESLSIYTKFRSLGFRMRELYEMLKYSETSTQSFHQLSAEVLQSREKKRSSSSSGRGDRKAFSSNDFQTNQTLYNLTNASQNNDKSVLYEVLQSYRVIRTELLQPVLHDYLHHLTIEAFTQVNVTPPNSSSHPSQNQKQRASVTSISISPHTISALCNVIRNSYAILFRTSQLEQQLYLSLYRAGNTATTMSQQRNPSGDHLSDDSTQQQTLPSSSPTHATSVVHLDSSIEIEHYQHLVEIISEISSHICGHLRSLIIKESSVESLCRVIHTLSQDVISQLEGTRLHQEIFQRLHEHLLRTTSDARERLVYCSEVSLRQQVSSLPPLPTPCPPFHSRHDVLGSNL